MTSVDALQYSVKEDPLEDDSNLNCENINVALIDSSSTNSAATDKALQGPNLSTSDDENMSHELSNSRNVIIKS